MDTVRLLITTYYSAFLNPGGGETELLGLIEGLRMLGIDADVYGPSSRPLSSYSSVLHFSVQADGLTMLQRAKSQKKSVFLWPNLWWDQPPASEEKNLVASFFELADKVIFKSKSELAHVRQYISIKDEKTLHVPVPLSANFLHPSDPRLFKRIYDLDKYILWIGVLNRKKNQLTAIRALRDIDVPMVFVGHPNDEDYFEECRSSAPSHFIFVPQMPPASEILCSAVQGCSAFLEVPLEPPGASALEAALASRPLILSEGPWTKEHFGSHAVTVNPLDEEAIARAVRNALQQPFHGEALSREIQRKHLAPHSLVPMAEAIKRSARARTGHDV
ncbi:hypothetical protein C9I57_12895 [Trinickia symbiotica]|uniref:Glycosyl transferase family 1 domain-containing protein n=1 Tax=Trinickia symbiotica TaxID=863227 RepID=A0A2T3XW09_9BURK|nr:glycosyltransferase [Trinickia symbiotica]PTB20710.1 hypothetical protein C9I57_12895 [Trinickia symbiotica]